MRQLGEGSWDDQMAAIRAEHGRGAARWLADTLGRSARQARRYLSGEARPRKVDADKLAAMSKHAGRRIAADKLRSIRTVRVGHVDVVELSPVEPEPGGARNVGARNVGGAMGVVADAWLSGMDDQAADAFDAAVITAYAGDEVTAQEAANPSGLGSVLGIGNYRDGIDYD
jgi:hypothetical protein